MPLVRLIAVILVLIGTLVSPNVDQRAAADPGDLSLLAPGQHLFIWKGLDPWTDLPAATQQELAAKYQTAVDSGMDVGFISVDWAQLEPEEGVYDKDALQGPLHDVRALDQQIIVNINTFDSESLVIPDYLLDPDNPDTFKSDLQFADNPVVLEAWHNLLDWAIPMILEAGGVAISVGNEIDNRWSDLYEQYAEQHDTSAANDPYYGDYDRLRTDAAAFADQETPHNVAFINDSRAYIRAMDNAEDLAVTITVRRTGAKHNSRDPRFFRCIKDYIGASDVVLWNYYGQIENGFSDPEGDYSNDFLVESPDTIPGALDLMEQYSGGKPMMIQEAGFPAGASLNSSGQHQQDWFQTLFAELAKRPAWRAIGVFLMVDPSNAFIDSYIQPIADSLPEPFKTRIMDMYHSYGLNKLADGSARPAWSTFLAAITQSRSTHGVSSRSTDQLPPIPSSANQAIAETRPWYGRNRAAYCCPHRATSASSIDRRSLDRRTVVA